MSSSENSFVKSVFSDWINWVYAILVAKVVFSELNRIQGLPAVLVILLPIALSLLSFANFSAAIFIFVLSFIFSLAMWRFDFAIAVGIVLITVWAFGKGKRLWLSAILIVPMLVSLKMDFVGSLAVGLFEGPYGGIYVGLGSILVYTSKVLMMSPSIKNFPITVKVPSHVSTATFQDVVKQFQSQFHIPTSMIQLFPLKSAEVQQAMSSAIRAHQHQVDLLRYLPHNSATSLEHGITIWMLFNSLFNQVGLFALVIGIGIAMIVIRKIQNYRRKLVALAIVMFLALVFRAIIGGSVFGITALFLSFVFLGLLVVGDQYFGQYVRNYFQRHANGRQAVVSVHTSYSASGPMRSVPVMSTTSLAKKSALSELEQIVGLEEVKKFVKDIRALARVQKLRHQETTSTLHMILTGHPGTGKTTIARLIGRMLREEGILASGQFVEVSRADLVAPYVGQTAQKTLEKIQAAMGGVLFIDEAYSLIRGTENDFGREALDMLVKAMEENRGNIVVMLAGYPKEMDEFLRANPGLKSRFPHHIKFPDNTAEDILQIALGMFQEMHYTLEEGADALLLKQIKKAMVKGQTDNGNGRLARNLVESAVRNQSSRLSDILPQKQNKKQFDKGVLNILTKEDFGFTEESVDVNEILLHIDNMVGLREVKSHIRTLHALLVTQHKRRVAGLKVEGQVLHTIFAGNPGTGKTTVARYYADMLYGMDFLKRNIVVEADRATLVAGYQGQTAIKTTAVFEQALGGVLFIDEAYTLNRGTNDTFGMEAVETLMKLMEDHREDIVIILAGYGSHMDDFVKLNPGLHSRIPHRIQFDDYSIEELVEISRLEFDRRGYATDGEVLSAIHTYMSDIVGRPDFGNGRSAKHLVEQAIRNHAVRISNLPSTTHLDLVKIAEEDIVHRVTL